MVFFHFTAIKKKFSKNKNILFSNEKHFENQPLLQYQTLHQFQSYLGLVKHCGPTTLLKFLEFV
jgi:hypothetical protein